MGRKPDGKPITARSTCHLIDTSFDIRSYRDLGLSPIAETPRGLVLSAPPALPPAATAAAALGQIADENKDSSVLWTFFPRRKLDSQCKGHLLYRKGERG